MHYKQFKTNGWWKTEADCDVCRWPSNSRWTKHYKIFLSIFFQFKTFHIWLILPDLIFVLPHPLHVLFYDVIYCGVDTRQDIKNIKSKLSRKFLHILWVIKLLSILWCSEQRYRWIKLDSQYFDISRSVSYYPDDLKSNIIMHKNRNYCFKTSRMFQIVAMI